MRTTIIAALLCACAAPALPADTGAQARREKCAYLWRTMAPASFSPKLVNFFCTEYEQAGIGPEWFFSLANWYYATGLNPRMSYSANGLWARGLTDCTQLNAPRSAFADLGGADLFNPYVSIRNDRFETASYHKQTGLEGWALRRKVFLPGTPRGWSPERAERRRWEEQAKWERVAKKFRSHLADWYCSQAGRK